MEWKQIFVVSIYHNFTKYKVLTDWNLMYILNNYIFLSTYIVEFIAIGKRSTVSAFGQGLLPTAPIVWADEGLDF